MNASSKYFSFAIVAICVAMQCRAQQTQRIISFTASEQNISGVLQIQLFWKSVNEDGWCDFFIERDSNNQGNFIRITDTNPNLFHVDTLDYFYPDFGPFNASTTYCYRIRLDTMDYTHSTDCYFNGYTDTLCVLFTGVSESGFSNPAVTVYPDPTDGGFLITSNSNINKIDLYNMLGEKLNQFIVSNVSYQINLENQSAGVYLLRVNINDKFISKRIVKQY
jgi:hypothetical protein